MFANRTNPHVFVSVLILLMVLLCLPFAALAENKSINTGKVKGTVTNLDWSYLSVVPDIDLSWDGWMPILKFSVTARVGGSGNFDLNIKGGTLPAGTRPGDHVTADTHGIESFTLKENIFDGIPKIVVGSTVKAKMIMGATQEVDVKGRFNIAYEIKLSNMTGLSYGGDSDIDYTTIRPKNKNSETVVCVGTDVGGVFELGVIGYAGYELGPIIKLDLSLTDNGMASATLEKDTWYGTLYHRDDVDSLHTCAEYGKDGCVKGRLVNTVELSANGHVHLHVPIIDIDVYNYDWSKPKARTENKNTAFHQSLAWKEPLEETEQCDHMLYKVPVYVWLDEEHTQAKSDIFVKNKDRTQGDATAARYDRGTTGKNPYLGAGRVNLYFPYKAGKYTITTDTSGTSFASYSGEAQTANMVRGANEPVHIVLRSTATRQLSVEKKWDIDFENKDRPKEIEVLLQAQYYNTGRFSWVGVQKATLSAANNWSHTFDAVPKSELNAKGEAVDIKYRVRELKPKPSDAIPGMDELNHLFPEDIGEVIPGADGIFNPDHGQLAAESSRVVPARTDLDNTHVWEVLKKTVTDFNTLWEITPSKDFLTKLGKDAFFPQPTVVYPVEAYTTIVGEEVAAHETKYKVDYKEEKDKTTITNTALLETAIYKRWIMLGDAEAPDEVWVMLGYRIKEDYRRYIGSEVAEKFLGLWLPVWKPLNGDVASIFTALSSITDVEWLKYLDYLITFDVLGAGNLSFAIARLQKPTEDVRNPLQDWRAKFQTKKYGWFIIPGMPVEFQAEELSSAIITDVLKYLTGLDIPVSLIINPDGLYITVPGKSIQIPYLDKDWERTANVINTWYDSRKEPAVAIGGTKVWAGDEEDDRPDSLTIVVRDGDREIGRTTIKKADNVEQKTWIWTLKQSEVTAPGMTLDPNKTYSVSEIYPEGYDGSQYVLTVDGHNLLNTRVNPDRPPKIVIRKTLLHTGLRDSRTFRFNLLDETGKRMNGVPYVITLPGEGSASLDLGITPERIRGKELTKFRVEELDIPAEYEAAYSGPVQSIDSTGAPVYTFGVTNTSRTPKYYLEVLWRGDTEADRPEKADFWFSGHKFAIRADEGWRQGFNPSWEPKPTKEDAEGYLKTFQADPVPKGYLPDPAYEVVFEGDKIVWRAIFTKAGPITVRGRLFWKGDFSKQWLRPGIVRISIANQVQGVVRSMDVTAADGWQFSVSGLPETDENGTELKYFVTESTTQYTEDNVPADTPGVKGYVTTYAPPVYVVDQKTWICDITNEKEKVRYIVRKIWKDEEDEAKARPESVTVKAWETTNDGEPVAEAVLNSENNWSTVFALPKGSEYRISEEPVKDYATTITTAAQTEDSVLTVITNEYTDVFTVSIRKEWAIPVGDGFVGIVKPASVNYVLRRNGAVFQQGTLSEANGWNAEYPNVPVNDENGQPYTYTVEESPVPANYMAEYEEDRTEDRLDLVILNKYTKRNIRFSKIWDAGTTAGPVTVHLVANGSRVAGKSQTIQAAEAGSWFWFNDLDIYDREGKVIEYSVTEDPVPEGHSCFVSGSMGKGFTVRNVNSEKTVAVKVNKVRNTYTGTSPQSVMVCLMETKEDGSKEIVARQQLPVNGSWEYTFPNVPKYHHTDTGFHTPIHYSVDEEEVPGYDKVIADNPGTDFTITNTQRTLTGIRVTKVWEDEHDEAKKRPAAIGLHLLKNGVELTDSITIAPVRTEGDTWTYRISPNPGTFFPEYENGKPVMYSLREDRIDHYEEPVITGNAAEGFTVTNTYPNEMILTVRKEWIEPVGTGIVLPADRRPKTVTFDLKQNGAVLADDQILRENDHWSKSYVVPIHDESGRAYTYTVEEAPFSDRYRVAYAQNTTEDGIELIIQNKYTKRSVSFRKRWDPGAAPVPVSIYLEMNDQRTDRVREIRPEEADQWFSFDDLDIYDKDGNVIEYSVAEYPVPKNYTSFISGSLGSGFTITNVQEADTIDIRVTKSWDSKTRTEPDSVLVYLKEAGSDEIITQQRLSAGSLWQYTFQNVPKYRYSGFGLRTEIQYTVDEEEIPGYTKEIAGDPQNGFTITNTEMLLPEIRVRKIWNDENNKAGQRPQDIELQLLKNGDIVRQITVTRVSGEGNIWNYTITPESGTGFPVYENGKRITYTIQETQIPHYEKPVITGQADTGFTVTNANRQEITVAVKKEWAEPVRPGRPNAVFFTLLQNHAFYKRDTLRGDDWELTYVVPTCDSSGMPYTYTVVEDPVSGYFPEVEVVNTNTGIQLVITNKLNERNISFRKIWEGGEPAPADIYLVRNGAIVLEKHQRIQPEQAGTECTFDHLDMYDSKGKMIAYSVTEDPVPNAYTCYVTGSMDEGFVITNSKGGSKTSVTVTKQWDTADQGEKDPIGIRLINSAKGEIVDFKVLPENGQWTTTFSDLDRLMFSENGLAVPIPYMAEEEPVSGYSAIVEGRQEEGFRIINTPDTIDMFYATVLWDDLDDEDGRRPASVTLRLMKNGMAYRDDEVDIRRVGDSWDYEITPAEGVTFPLVEDGETVEYSIREDPVAYYEEPLYNGDAETAFIVTNRHRSETHDLTVYKDWNTPDTRQPESVQVTLLSDLNKENVFKPVETVILREPEWMHLFENLPLHHQGRLIQYRTEEKVPAGYERPYIIHDGEDIRIENWKRQPSPDYTYRFSFTKIWSGETLPSIDWTLYDPNGQIVKKDFTRRIVSDSEWEYDKWFDSNVNEYYVVENVPTGYTVRYENVGSHKEVTDRCYSGGRIINYRVPPTGDRMNIVPWLTGLAAGLAGIGLLLVIRPGSGKKSRRNRP